MNKDNLVRTVAKETGFTIRDVSVVVDTLFDTIKNTLAVGDDISITGFGTFEVKNVPARTRFNVHSGETFNSPESKTPRFRASSIFKAMVK